MHNDNEIKNEEIKIFRLCERRIRRKKKSIDHNYKLNV